MNQLLKADCYKLFKNKSLYVCSIICLAFTVILVYTLNFIADQGMAEMVLDFSTTIGTAFDGNTHIFVAIILSLFIGSEFTLGTIKNTASKAFSRTKIYMSKWLTMTIVSDVLLIAFVTLYGVLALAFWGYGNPGDGFVLELVKVLGLQILLNTALTSVFTMLTMLLRQGGGAIAVNICLLSFTSTIVSLLQYIIQSLTGKEVNLVQYLLTTTISEVASMELTTGLVTRSIVLSIGVIAVSLAIGIFSFNKRDIK